MELPTIDNVRLPKYWVSMPQKWAQDLGAVAAIPGGLNCPWCDAEMKMNDENMIAVCINNPIHIVQYLPWGG